jgi:hypothetical protein
MTHIMNYTAEQREKGGRYISVKSATSETWWPEDADHIMFIRGRIGFDLPAWFVPADEKQKPTSAFFAGAIAVFDKTWRGECFSYIDRVELEAKGRKHGAGAVCSRAGISSEGCGSTPAAKPVAEPVVESRIWPLEVNLAFGQVEGAADLGESQQNRLKAHINHLWLSARQKMKSSSWRLVWLMSYQEKQRERYSLRKSCA